MRQKYLCENYPSEYLHLVITEKLWKQLEDLEEECHEMLDRLMEQMAKREGLTEHMKSTDQPGWIRKMNSIQSRAEEIVIHELIYTNKKYSRKSREHPKVCVNLQTDVR